MTPYRFAVIGNGYMARRYMTCLDSQERTEVALVVNCKGIIGGNAQSGSSAATEDNRTVLSAISDDPAIDAVIVCSPDGTHPSYVAELLSSGKLIVCEKPLARTEEEFRRLLELAAGRKNSPVVGMNCRFKSGIQHLKRLIEGGVIKVPNLINAAYYSNVVPILQGKGKGWWLEYPLGIVPFLHGGAIHVLDSLRFLFGEVDAALCVAASRGISRRLGGDTFVVLLKFASGALANVVISGTSLAPNRFQISIESEHCSIDEHHEYVVDPETNLPVTRPVPADDSKDLERQMAHVVDVLDGNAMPLNSIEEAYRNFKVIRACEESSRTATWVAVTSDVRG